MPRKRVFSSGGLQISFQFAKKYWPAGNTDVCRFNSFSTAAFLITIASEKTLANCFKAFRDKDELPVTKYVT